MAKARKSKSRPRKAKVAPKRKMGVAAAAGGALPPYKCMTTPVQGVCLRFNLDPATGQYNQPPGGIRMNCTACQYFFN